MNTAEIETINQPKTDKNKLVLEVRNYLKIFFIQIFAQFSDSVFIWLKTFKTKPKQALIELFIFILILGLSILWAGQNFKQTFYSQTSKVEVVSTKPITTNETKQPILQETPDRQKLDEVTGRGQNITPADTKEKLVLAPFFDMYTQTVDIFSGIFNNFIGYTHDPTTRVKRVIDENGSGGNFDQELQAINYTGDLSKNRINFSGQELLPSSQLFASSLLSVAGPLLVLLFMLSGYRLFKMENSSQVYEEFKETFGKVLWATLMTVFIAPVIFSVTILSVNGFNQGILSSLSGGITDCTETSSLTCTIKTIAKKMREQKKVDEQPIYEGKNWVDFEIPGVNQKVAFGKELDMAMATAGGIMPATPTIILFLVILVVFIWVCFTFVIRYLYLYLLCAVYPLVTVCYAFKKTSQATATFWSKYTSLLLQQPLFLLCFAIFYQIALGILTSGEITFLSVVLFTASVVFLLTGYNFLVGIFADIGISIQTAVAGGLMSSTAYTATGRSLGYLGRQSKNLYNRTRSGFKARQQQNSKAPNSTQNLKTSVPVSKQTSASFNSNKNTGDGFNTMKDETPKNNTSNSPAISNLSAKGVEVQDISNEPNSGLYSLQGDFYEKQNPKTGLSSLYYSVEDAVIDGNDPNNITKSTKRVSVADLSSESTAKLYNEYGQKYSMSKGLNYEPELHTTSDENQISKNFDLTMERNYARGFTGVLVNRPANTDPSKNITVIYNKPFEEKTKPYENSKGIQS